MSSPSDKCSQERLARGTVASTMRRAAYPSGCARCGDGAGCSAIEKRSLRVHLCPEGAHKLMGVKYDQLATCNNFRALLSSTSLRLAEFPQVKCWMWGTDLPTLEPRGRSNRKFEKDRQLIVGRARVAWERACREHKKEAVESALNRERQRDRETRSQRGESMPHI